VHAANVTNKLTTHKPNLKIESLCIQLHVSLLSRFYSNYIGPSYIISGKLKPKRNDDYDTLYVIRAWIQRSYIYSGTLEISCAELVKYHKLIFRSATNWVQPVDRHVIHGLCWLVASVIEEILAKRVPITWWTA